MNRNQQMIQSLLNKRFDCKDRLDFINYEGSIEIKTIDNERYIYLRKRYAGRNKSILIDKYNDVLFNILDSQSKEYKQIKAHLFRIERELKVLGLFDKNLPLRVSNIVNMLENNFLKVVHTFITLENISINIEQENLIINKNMRCGLSFYERDKISSLVKAWRYILERQQLMVPTNYYILHYLAKILVDKGYNDTVKSRKFRKTPIFLLPVMNENDIVLTIEEITMQKKAPIDIAIDLWFYCTKLELFKDQSRSLILIFINHFLISRGEGFIVVPENEIRTFQRCLYDYKMSKNSVSLRNFFKEVCWKKTI